MTTAPMTVVETGEFIKRTKPLMSDSERADLVAFVGANPEAGEIIPETGGFRKLRWALATANKTTRAQNSQTIGQSIIQGLEEAIAWSKGENDNVRVTLVHIPEVDVRKVRVQMGLSQAQFATRFGLPPPTLRNWAQRRVTARRTDPSFAHRDREAPGGG